MRISQKWFLSAICLLILLFFLTGCKSKNNGKINFHAPKLILNTSAADENDNMIIAAFQDATQNREDVLAFLIFDIVIDHIDMAASKDLALIWYSLSDPQLDEIISGELGLAIATYSPVSEAQSSWRITLQADENWQQMLKNIPEELLAGDVRSRYQDKPQALPHVRQTFGGYRLPWAPGDSKYLTSSIGHVYIYKTCPSSCLYAFDFADGTMWPVLAAKGGRVRAAVWQYPNGNSKNANYLVIEDRTTSPVTYQVYMHLAQNSIPVELRKTGAAVVQGQMIGVVDDTGPSSGHHLHFHVHTNPGSYWGNSVDITFDDVDINGGRPRTCYETKLFPSLGKYCRSGNSFISRNNDYQLPTGGIHNPTNGEMIKQQYLRVNSWAKDDSGIQSMQVMLNFDGNWLLVGQPANGEEAETNIDLCQLGIPDGDFYLSLEITDKAGKKAEGLPGLTQVTKHYKCPLPPPACEANPNQIALFESPEFQGHCAVFDKGKFDNLRLLEIQILQIGSIQIGDDVYAVLGTQNNRQTVLQNIIEPEIGPIETRLLTQIEVIEKPDYPSAPTPELIAENHAGETQLTHLDSIIVQWSHWDPTLEYQAVLTQGQENIDTLAWTSITEWHLPPLKPGTYHLLLRSRNILGTAQTEMSFTVDEADVPPVTKLEDLPEESDTTKIILRWHVMDEQDDLHQVEVLYRENNAEWSLLGSFPPQVNETVFYGIPGAQYNFGVRGVDIGGNVEEMHAGSQATVRIMAECKSDRYDNPLNNDNEAAHANPIALNETQTHNFCPTGDQDWFVFVAEKDAVYRIHVVPSSPAITANIDLYAMNGAEPLSAAIADDNTSLSKLVWSAPKDGIFYLKITPANERLSGTNTNYTFEIQKVVQFHTPSMIMTTLIIPILWGLLKLRKHFTGKRTNK